jgi:taurine dioxygenase
MSPLAPSELDALFRAPVDLEDVYSEAIDAWENCGSTDPIERTIAFYVRLYLQDDILVKVDRASMLHSLEVPPPEAGGNTYFANMFAAYETLPADLKQAVGGKIAVHDASTNSAGMLRKGYKEVTDVRQTVGAHHPLVRTEPKTGRKALFLGRRPNAYIVGLEVSKSEALLDALWAHATQPRFAMCHEWKVGDVLMWNNLAVLHRRDPFDPKARRVMHRSQIKGNERIT